MARPSLGLSKINFYLDPKVLDAYKWLATQRGTTYSELIRAAALAYIVDEINKERGNIETLSFAQAGDANG